LKTLTRKPVSAIEGVNEDLKKSGVSQSMQMGTMINVFYATDRCKEDASYTRQPGRTLSYGLQTVSIPRGHARGKIESPKKRGQGNPVEHFWLGVHRSLMPEPEFLGSIRTECNRVCSQLITPSQNSHSAMMLCLLPVSLRK
jgi:esterase/lipase superfamily enzyme